LNSAFLKFFLFKKSYFRYEQDHKVNYCSYDLDPETGLGKTHHCKPKNVSSTLKYSGTDKNVCQITVSNVTNEENCTWATRLGDERNPREISVIVASPVVDGIIVAPPVQAGKPGTVTCTMNGGRPAPFMSMEMEGLHPVNDSQIQTPDDNGIYTSVQGQYYPSRKTLFRLMF
jgi:hypothetical protein